jgi:hypothetical protein
MYNQSNYRESRVEDLVREKMDLMASKAMAPPKEMMDTRLRRRDSDEPPEIDVLNQRERDMVIDPTSWRPSRDLFDLTMEKLDNRRDETEANKEFDFFKDRLKPNVY